MSLAKALNLKRYDPSELREVYRCTRCSAVLQNSVYKRCETCRSGQSKYMQRYRYDQDHDLSTVTVEGRLSKIDNDFEEFLKMVRTNEHQDVSKLVVRLQLPEYILPLGESVEEKKRLMRVHFVNRVLAIQGGKFQLRSSSVKDGGKLCLRYMCSQDVKLRRGKKREKLPCGSSLRLNLGLQSNELKLEFSHKCHAKLM